MAEEDEGLESGTAGGQAADPASVFLAFGAAAHNKHVAAKAEAYLEKQGRLVDLQSEYLADKDRYELSHLRWRRFTEQMKGALQAMTAVVGIAVASGFGMMIWDAAHSRGLVIESFSVPPDLAARGLGGQVVASQMLDRLTAMTATESSRAAQSYANNWGDNIKVEIPETGVSIGELERFLHGWLGHDKRISGEVYHTQTGIALTARVGADSGATFTGAESDLDAMVQKAAEQVYETTQPYRYANYLDRNYDPVGLQDRVARATAIYHKLIGGDDPLERAWAWNGLGTIAFRFHADDRESAADYRKAIASTPDFTIGWFAMANREVDLGHEENALAEFQTASRLLHRDSIPDLNPHYIPNARLAADAHVAYFLGDYAAAIPIAKAGAELTDDFSVLARTSFQNWVLSSLVRLHDMAGLRSYLRYLGPAAPTDPFFRVPLYAQLQDWQTVRALEPAAKAKPAGYIAAIRITGSFDLLRPPLALARAHLGDFAGAETLIGPAPADCDSCLRARAQIAELRGQHGRADWWFSRAVNQAPSIPFADADWGQALLARGDTDAAIAQFTAANQKGPHFADPLEMWGEALMAQNRSGLAPAKFEEAEKYAPRWGRLHLKWGEALVYAGKSEAAKKQFAIAAGLDLTPADKSELLKANPHG